ncbi:MAG: formimidoylglutamase [Roseivirga sp.]|nr:formimidoylglutamase [Roseivirga sp.]
MLKFFHQIDLKAYVSIRKGEIKVGERIKTLRKNETLKALTGYVDRGARFALVGIPESVGVMANMGRTGTEVAWEAFLQSFLNVQSNRFLDGSRIVLLGEIDTKDVQARAENLDVNAPYYSQKLHILCAEVDELVSPIIEAVVEAGLIPIVIGGGQNNAYPLLMGTAQGLGRKRGIHAINMDAHADFRALEGRHSGNGFSYAKERGYLHKYFAFGLHQSHNAENMLLTMDSSRNVKYQFMEEITYLDKHLMAAIEYVYDEHIPCGIELDMDAIRMMPSSAVSPSGFSLEQARHFVRKCARSLKPAYLHLPEAAPGSPEEALIVGKSLSYLVTDFIKNIGE